MRRRASKNGVSVHAISGSHAVLLAMDAEAQARKGLLGFAVKVGEVGSHHGSWLRGFKFFEATVPDPQPGERRSTLEQPIQSFLWGHYSASPDTPYRYTVRPVYGTPASLEYGEDVSVEIRTESTMSGTHSVFFNRGAIPSQAFADLFGNRPPADPNDPTAADVKWLSRGLLEAALTFIGQARGKHYALRVAAYEFTYPPILEALAAAACAGADVKVVYEDGQQKVKGVLSNTSTTDMNRAAIADAHFHDKDNLTLIPRTKRRSIPHNKFIVLLENDKPVQVWTGSTNFTSSGFLGQSNVGHIVRDEAVAGQYLAYWMELAQDPEPEPFQTWCSEHSPYPGADLPAEGITTMFSPRQRSKMLDWYGSRIEGAEQTVMLTAAFGVTKKLAERFDNDRDFLRFLLMERKNRNAVTQAMLERDRDTRIALGAALNKDAIQFKMGGHRLDEWLREEEHYRHKGHVFYVHTKILMVDTMTNDPLVFSGSANFSSASLLSNDENMLLIRGDTKVADIYTVEFMRLFNHFYFRYIVQVLTKQGRNDPTKAAFLDPTDSWVATNFKPGTYHCRRRELFR